MVNKEKILAVVPVFNEEGKIGKVLSKFPQNTVDKVMVINDGSTDNSLNEIQKYEATIVNHEVKRGVGAVIKAGIKYALDHNYSVLAILAGNGKDDPAEIPSLLQPICEENYDYVQGSRFLDGGAYDNLPIFRFVMIKLFSLIFFILTGFRGSDVTNGFRAYRLSIFEHRDIHIWQDWLDTYELEYYVHYKVLKLGYRVKEVPVSKIYPKERGVKYSKIRPFADWWRMISPLVYLTLRIRD